MSDFDAKVYWEERLKKDYTLNGVGYIGHGEEYNQWMYKVREKIFQRMIRSLNINLAQATVLDIGSGTGFYIDLWKRSKVANLEGCDITETAVENLIKNFPGHPFHCIDISEISNEFVSQHQYDVISIFDVLFHIVDDEKLKLAFANIHRMLKEDGIFILSDNFIHGPTFRSKHHISRNIDEYYQLLKEAGFEITSRKPMFVYMNAPVDTKNKFIKWFWGFQEKLIYRNKKSGGILGGFIYPFELISTYFHREGPSTEIMICKRIKK